jgi:hypothetical protein
MFNAETLTMIMLGEALRDTPGDRELGRMSILRLGAHQGRGA